jgi:hypothetical protein
MMGSHPGGRREIYSGQNLHQADTEKFAVEDIFAMVANFVFLERERDAACLPYSHLDGPSHRLFTFVTLSPSSLNHCPLFISLLILVSP